MSTKTSVAKDVFAYLLTFVMLYLGAIYLIGLLWQVIDVAVPDPTLAIWAPYESMRFFMAGLIVVWPVFLLMSRYLVHDLVKYPEKTDLWVRKWLTYLTIFVAAITGIVDLIAVLNRFLGGDLTTRFVLRVLVVLVVAAGVLCYEFWELTREPKAGKRAMYWMTFGSIALIVLSMIVGFVYVGTPQSARLYKLDTQRVSDLQSLQSGLLNYWNQKDVLPDSIDQLRDPLTGFVQPFDPVSKQPYGYTKTGELTFQLCANFDLETPSWEKNQWRQTMYEPVYPYSGMPQSEDWTHTAGQTCFDRTIDPELHRVPELVK